MSSSKVLTCEFINKFESGIVYKYYKLSMKYYNLFLQYNLFVIHFYFKVTC